MSPFGGETVVEKELESMTPVANSRSLEIGAITIRRQAREDRAIAQYDNPHASLGGSPVEGPARYPPAVSHLVAAVDFDRHGCPVRSQPGRARRELLAQSLERAPFL